MTSFSLVVKVINIPQVGPRVRLIIEMRIEYASTTSVAVTGANVHYNGDEHSNAVQQVSAGLLSVRFKHTGL